VDDADEDDDKEEDGADENAYEDKKVDAPDDVVDGEDEEGDNTDEEGSEIDNYVYENILWDRGGEKLFIRKVARIIAIADNHYPVCINNIKQMNDALQLAIHLTRTAKNTYKDIEYRNYMERIS
jgi:hypothetical protein